MPTVDPSYPLYPIVCILAAVMLLLVLLTSFAQQSWNLGVAFLCFWLLCEDLTNGIDAIVWADNTDVKLYIYCDIVTRLQVVSSVVKPMATLLITRRLHLITSLRSIEYPDKAARRKNLAIEWFLGLLMPLVVAGPLYYVGQALRFEIDEGFGCGTSSDNSVLGVLLLNVWSVIFPLISIAIYYPKMVRTFYRHSRDTNRFLQSNNSVSRTNYFRILALASIDVLLTLPIGIVTIVLSLLQSSSLGALPFYNGWTYVHTEWEPMGYSYAWIVAQGTATVAQHYFSKWTSPVLSFVIFGLFGVTSEARASYWRVICTAGGWIGWKPTPGKRKACSPLGGIEFGERSQRDMSLGLESQPSYINPRQRDAETGCRLAATSSEVERSSNEEIAEEEGRISNSIAHA